MNDYLMSMFLFLRQRAAYEQTTYAQPFPSFIEWLTWFRPAPGAERREGE